MSASLFRRLMPIVVTAGLIILAGPALAQSTWTNAAGGNWSVGANWVGGSPPTSGTTTSLTFGSPSVAGSSYTATNDIGSTPFVLNGLTFNGNAGATVTINGLSNTNNGLTFNGATPTITVGAGNAILNPVVALNTTTTVAGGAGTITFTNAVNAATSGTGISLVQTSTGSLVLSGGGSFDTLSVQAGAASATGGILALTAPTGTGNVNSGLQIGAASGQTGSFTANGGATVNVTENVYIGDAAGSSGTLTVTGPGTVLNATGGMSNRLAVGNFGTGTLNITNGGAVNVGQLFQNRQAGSGTSTILVDGAGSTLQVINQATFGSFGVGNTTVQNGGTLTADSTFIIALNTGGNGTVTITGAGSSATVGVLAEIAPTNGGTGTLIVQNGASFSASNPNGGLLLGSFHTGVTGGTGTVTVTGSGSTITIAGEIDLADNPGSSATLNVLAGGSFNAAGDIFAGGAAASGATPAANATITVSGAGSTLAVGGSLIVGGGSTPGGIGNMTVSNGGSVTVNLNPIIGQDPGSNGTLNIQSGGTFTSSSDMFVGVFGANGTSPGAVGVVNVTGAGSTLIAAGNLIIGGGGGAPGGTGTLTVSNGAAVSVAGSPVIAFDAGSTGTLNIQSGGTFTSASSMFVGVTGVSGASPAALGTVNVTGTGSILSLPGTLSFLVFGGGSAAAGAGNLNLSAGGTVTAPNIGFGQDPGSTSTSVVDNATLTAGVQLVVADMGTATLTIQNGATASTAGALFVGSEGGGAGTVTVTGTGTTLTAAAGQLGGSGGTAGGTGVLNSNAGAVVTLTGPLSLYAGGTASVNGGSLIVGGLADGASGSTGTVSVATGSTLTDNLVGGSNSFSGVISGGGGLTVSGSGTQILTGANTYTGPTNLNGGVLNFTTIGNLGAGTVITFNGGTLQYAAGNTADITARTVTLNAGGGTIDTNGNNLTYANAIGGIGGLTKIGTGTLTLGGTNTYAGGTNVQNGTVQVAADANLGTGNVTGAILGTVAFTNSMTTTKSFAMNGGTILVAAGKTLSVNGGTVSSAFLDGAGTYASNGARFDNVTTTPSVTVTSNGNADQFVHFDNGGAFTVAAGTTATPVNLNGFTNEGSGSVTVNQNDVVNVANFQSYGTLTLNPGTFNGSSGNFTQLINLGSSKLFFDGGSRTFISTAAQAPNINAGIDLHGNDAVVAGGLLVNNGYVIDSTGGGHRIVADFGAVVKGAGFYQTIPQTINGGTFSTGNSPGGATAGAIVLGGPNDPNLGLSNYTWQINDAGPSATYPTATGTAGPTANAAKQVSGWGLLTAVVGTSPVVTTGNFDWDATPTDKLTIHLTTLLAPNDVNGNTVAGGGYGQTGDNTAGLMSDFDPTKSYVWKLFAYQGTYTGPTDTATLDASTAIDDSGFLNPHNGRFDLVLNQSSQEMDLTFTPTAVPEPGTLSLLGLAGLGLAAAARRRRAKK